MTHKFSDYKQFRNMKKTDVQMTSVPGGSVVIQAVEADPHNTHAVSAGVTWGLMVVNPTNGYEYFAWFDDKGRPVDSVTAITQARFVDVVLRRMVSHHFNVSWQTRTRYVSRRYVRKYDTLEEAVKKARQVHDKADPASEFICVSEWESWDDGTLHATLIRHNIDWWTGFLPWYEIDR